MLKSIPLAAVTATLFTGAASAAITASATVDLNMRSGPGPNFAVMHVIGANNAVIIDGCIMGSRWCMVSHGGTQGWAYSDYLAAPFNGAAVVVGLNTAALGLATLSADAQLPQVAAVQAPLLATAPATVLAPARALPAPAVVAATPAPAVVPAPQVTVGAAAPAVIQPAPRVTLGAVAPAVIQPAPQVIAANPIVPPLFVRTFIASSPLVSVALSTPIFVGATLPPEVTLVQVPSYQYPYAYVNGQAVLVDPATRRVVYVAA
jgi:uncharacterized protein YraI